MQAVFWRVLMNLGMFFHRMAPPRPPKPNFTRRIPSTISAIPGHIDLNFYVPKDYETQRRLWINRPEQDEVAGDQVVEVEEGGSGSGSSEHGMGRLSSQMDRLKKLNTISEFGTAIRRRSTSTRRWGGYPCVINFHGGGFTLGHSWDDARWCQTVVNECNAVVVSVDYRLAPEHPFPTAVEDGVDSVIYIHKHAEELGIDRTKIALSGFSSGGNMCFTVPLRLYDEMNSFPRDDISGRPPTRLEAMQRSYYGKANAPSDTSSTTRVAEAQEAEGTAATDHAGSSPTSSTQPLKRHDTIETVTEHTSAIPSDIKIACIVPWYPPVDYTRSREQRRATMARPDQELAALFTNLFDESYLHPPHTLALDSPYLSPGVAPTSLLKAGLPAEIIMHTCENDMLLDEGEVFKNRLLSKEVGKKVWYRMVEGVPHGWDKAPNPLKPTPGVREHYLHACKEMRRVFGPERAAGAGTRPVVERSTTKGWPTMAPRGSISVVR
jgi:putative ergosteryl-3beta-O-L-aspartate hydrolase